MALEIKHVADLLGLSLPSPKPFQFIIPSYQRGYRWERKQIEQLLDDLMEFYESVKLARVMDKQNRVWNRANQHSPQRATDNEDQTGFYCLQPLAVTSVGSGVYDVIDGQQRLTTVYLILNYLSDIHQQFPYDSAKKLENSLYGLTYQTRDATFFFHKEFKSSNNSTSNIDFYFMSRGYETISEWFQKRPGADLKILELLLPKEYAPGDEVSNAILHDVRFIWYETLAGSSISTFNNLNYGKIGLTAAELVKALLFQCDIHEVESRAVAKKDAYARSTKWSLMEEDLQNEFFWGMLTASSIDKDLHIELILDFVATDIDNQLQYTEQEGWDRNDDDWVFNVFSKAISDKQFKLPCHNGPLERIIDRIEYLWEEIQNVYSVFRNWYTDRELYHKIGLLILLKTTYGKGDHKTVIRELYESYRGNTKPTFKKMLINKIGDNVKIKKKVSIEAGGTVDPIEREKHFDEINYEDDPDEIRKILLLFNVQETINRSKDDMMFPFQYAGTLNSLEHIHPQHLDESKIDYETFKTWYETRCSFLNNQGALGIDSVLDEAVQRLNVSLSTKDSFEEQKQQCLHDLAVVDTRFDDLAGMKPEFMHTLYNMALVDNETNSSLGNKLIDQKKRILKDRQEKGCYIPIGTWRAFNKYYSDEIRDMKFWSQPDRDAYYSAIKAVYDLYV